MDAVAEKKTGVHQGRNVKVARTCGNVTQEDLAFRVDLSQSKISALELQEVIDDETLNKVAAALEVPVSFLKNFQPEDAINNFTFNNNNEAISVTSAENSPINNYNYPLDKITELYDKLLQEKEKQIALFEKQLSSFQKQLDELKTLQR